jgi:RHS repeat-associated protein
MTRNDSVNVWEAGADPQPSLGNNVHHEIVWFGDRPVGQYDPGSFTRYTFSDHLGTPILQTDGSGTIVWRVEYEPFGNIYEVREGNRTDQPLRFPGQELGITWEGPEENYNIFRWYKSGWGRYTQSDPLDIWGGLNLFEYAQGNPIRNFDRVGLLCGAGITDYIVPDQFPSLFGTIDLTKPCTIHDNCYSQCGANQAACDWQFYQDISKECNKVSKVLYAQCKLIAATYEIAVETFGDAAFKNSQKNCHSCPLPLAPLPPWVTHPLPKSPGAPSNCMWIGGKQVCVGTGI